MERGRGDQGRCGLEQLRAPRCLREAFVWFQPRAKLPRPAAYFQRLPTRKVLQHLGIASRQQ